MVALHRDLSTSMLQIRLLLISVFCICGMQMFSQNDTLRKALNQLSKPSTAIDTNSTNPHLTGVGNVNVVADSAIINLEKGTRRFRDTKGYRVQIFLGTVDQAKAERNKYLSLGLPYSCYSKQIVPEQALQIGDFINRMEMEKNLEIIRKHYPKAFGVVELIEPPKYHNGKKQ